MRGKYVVKRRLEELDRILPERDKTILRSLEDCRYLLTGQIARLHFIDRVTPTAALRAANRIMQKLKDFGMVEVLERRIGGTRAGSGSYAWTLTESGVNLLHLNDEEYNPRKRTFEPSLNFLKHTLEVSETYVQLTEICRRNQLELIKTETEPNCWRSYNGEDGKPASMKPDMFRYFDMFAGVGGFRAGLERAGGYRCIGHCEIDKHASAAYRRLHNIKETEVYYEDAKTINTETIPEFDLLCAGFPCQAFSIAGKRQGFADPRGTLFFEIARVLKTKRPPYLLLENVPGLLSHSKGQTFAAILATLCGMGYSIEWTVLNSADYNVAQNRKRVYIVGYLNRECAGQILPFNCSNRKALIQIVGGRQDRRVYNPAGLAKTLLAKSGGLGGKTGLYFIDMNQDPKITPEARCITARYDHGIGNRKAESSGVLLIKEATKRGYKEAAPGDSVNLSYAEQNKKRGRVGEAIAKTIDTSNQQGVVTLCGRIRRLMPRECFRLQGFYEEQIDKLLENNSDAQAYKQAGNAVTVNVVHALASRLKNAHAAAVGVTKAETRAA
ncbi:MAG: DNA (cytosine-5-)-methyltransferase [Oscillospiraceae bacterium]|jgi:DNA (cytosine-5)-methyltransferase 1|nr:DNA (cytosine-5-)-methyltransferase [Oscillospiraceae bacterium]